jgi:hypothetical protein
VDPTGKIAGRGAYLHDQRSCWERGLKNTLAHALKMELSELDRETLRAYMETLPEMGPADINGETTMQAEGPDLSEQNEFGTSGKHL